MHEEVSSTRSASSTDCTTNLATRPKFAAPSFSRAPAVSAVSVDAFHEVLNQKGLAGAMPYDGTKSLVAMVSLWMLGL